MEPCWILPCSLVRKPLSQMANTIGARILPLIFSFFIPHLLKWSQCMCVAPAQSLLPIYLLLCPPHFFFLPPYQPSPTQSVRVRLSQNVSLITFAHHDYSFSECSSQSQRAFLLAHWLFIYIYSSSTDYKILRAGP